MIPREVYIAALMLAAGWIAILARFRFRWWTCLLSVVMFVALGMVFLSFPSG